jgi:hypothetical protein
MGWDDVSRANCVAILCAARSATGQPADGIVDSVIRLAVGAVLRASSDLTDARCEVASGPKTVESPFMLMNLLRKLKGQMYRLRSRAVGRDDGKSPGKPRRAEGAD